MTSKSRVCIIPGDGAAPEAMLASLRVLDALALPIECDAVPPGSELLDLSIAEREALIRERVDNCLLYTSPSPRDGLLSRMPSSA